MGNVRNDQRSNNDRQSDSNINMHQQAETKMGFSVYSEKKKLLNVVLYGDKWCKFPWQPVLTLCLWIQPWPWDTVDPCWLSGGHLGSKHLPLWQVAVWISLLALYATSQRSTWSGNRPNSAEAEVLKLAQIQCLIRTSKAGWNMPDGDTQGFLTYRKMYRVLYRVQS